MSFDDLLKRVGLKDYTHEELYPEYQEMMERPRSIQDAVDTAFAVPNVPWIEAGQLTRAMVRSMPSAPARQAEVDIQVVPAPVDSSTPLQVLLEYSTIMLSWLGCGFVKDIEILEVQAPLVMVQFELYQAPDPQIVLPLMPIPARAAENYKHLIGLLQEWAPRRRDLDRLHQVMRGEAEAIVAEIGPLLNPALAEWFGRKMFYIVADPSKWYQGGRDRAVGPGPQARFRRATEIGALPQAARPLPDRSGWRLGPGES